MTIVIDEGVFLSLDMVFNELADHPAVLCCVLMDLVLSWGGAAPVPHCPNLSHPALYITRRQRETMCLPPAMKGAAKPSHVLTFFLTIADFVTAVQARSCICHNVMRVEVDFSLDRLM